MDTHELRASFRRFAGPGRYSKFIRAINKACRVKGRLLFWQEQLWKNFIPTFPDAPLTDKEVINLFKVCDVHESPLQSPLDENPLPEVRDTPEYEVAFDTLFPFAINRNLVCLRCREEREKWIEQNWGLCQILRCKTTYEEYSNRHLGALAERPELKKKMEQRSAEIAAQMEPGDELWEWDNGGWHRLAGSGGIAIVRNGKIVKQWCEWKS